MKFESKFGIGEIVLYKPHERGDNPYGAFLEVQAVCFAIDGSVSYVCRYPGTGVTTSFYENQLGGDPEFDQESGY